MIKDIIKVIEKIQKSHLVIVTTPCFAALYPTSSNPPTIGPRGGLTLRPAKDATLITRPPFPP